MSRNPQKVSTIGTSALAIVLLNTIILRTAATGRPEWYEALVFTLPLMALSLAQLVRTRRNL